MVKKLTVNCNKRNNSVPVDLYVGNPIEDSHPFAFQMKWLSEKQGVVVPQEIIEAFGKLQEIAQRTKLSFEVLCEQVIEEFNATKEIVAENKRINHKE